MGLAQLVLIFALPVAVRADQSCHSIAPTVSDSWCQSNCNAQPPNCPANLCTCGAGPSPGPAPKPVWPGPPPSPPPLPPPPGPDSGCSADQIKAHCTKCDGSKCTTCAQGYGVKDDACIAACLLPGYSKPSPPQKPGIYNGIQWVDECIDSTEEHFFGIGDWGGLTPGVPAPNIHGHRPENPTIDNSAQNLVANVMNARAEISKPKFVVNVGDNFYWGGVDWSDGSNTAAAEHCGDFVTDPSKACNHYRFKQYYDDIYNTPALATAPWFTVLGNHDWGGYSYETGWDGQIFKTWCPGKGSDGFNRWRMPGLYWRQKVQFRDFSVDFFMMDGNANDAWPHPPGDLNHNICQRTHNQAQGGVCNVPNATLRNEQDCYDFLNKMWDDGSEWLKAGLATSDADWQIVVTHYPPIWKKDFWYALDANKTGLDLLITGHTHVQELHLPDDGATNPMKNFTIPWIITGGGGGVTSEGEPDSSGKDDEYGFVDFTINKDNINIEMHSHGGTAHDAIVRRSATISPVSRQRAVQQETLYI